MTRDLINLSFHSLELSWPDRQGDLYKAYLKDLITKDEYNQLALIYHGVQIYPGVEGT